MDGLWSFRSQQVGVKSTISHGHVERAAKEEIFVDIGQGWRGDQYGRIFDVVALKTTKLRGQAWVVFSEVTTASNAVRQMQNFPFYDKPMRIQFAKGMSDCIAKTEGSFVAKDKRKKQDEKAEKKSSYQSANGVRSESNGGTPASNHYGRSSGQ